MPTQSAKGTAKDVPGCMDAMRQMIEADEALTKRKAAYEKAAAMQTEKKEKSRCA